MVKIRHLNPLSAKKSIIVVKPGKRFFTAIMDFLANGWLSLTASWYD
jgi:hypothetical protein